MTLLGVFGMTLVRVTNWESLTEVLTYDRISADDLFQVERWIRESWCNDIWKQLEKVDGTFWIHIWLICVYDIYWCVYIYTYELIFVYMLIALLKRWEDDGDISRWIGICFKTPWFNKSLWNAVWACVIFFRNAGTETGVCKTYWTNRGKNIEQWKKPSLFRVYREWYYPLVMWGL